jgi:hypothetical protein
MEGALPIEIMMHLEVRIEELLDIMQLELVVRRNQETSSLEQVGYVDEPTTPVVTGLDAVKQAMQETVKRQA